jgi:hypothetical protein
VLISRVGEVAWGGRGSLLRYAAGGGFKCLLGGLRMMLTSMELEGLQVSRSFRSSQKDGSGKTKNLLRVAPAVVTG